MNSTVEDIYITMLSKDYFSVESRVWDARWMLIDLGLPWTVKIIDPEGKVLGVLDDDEETMC